jgi:hypothetical protein
MEVRMNGPEGEVQGGSDDGAARRRAPAQVGGQERRDADLNRHGRQSADDGGIHGDGEGAAELDAEIARREGGGTRDQPGTGLGAGLTQRPPD